MKEEEREVETLAGVTPCHQGLPKADTSEITLSGSLWVSTAVACTEARGYRSCGVGIINCGNGGGRLQKDMQGLRKKEARGCRGPSGRAVSVPHRFCTQKD